MASSGARGVEAALASLLLPLCALSGAVVLAGFFFPSFVVDAVPGEAWLAVALSFFISGLGYLAVLPYSADPSERSGEPALFYVRRTGVVPVVREFLRTHDVVTFGVPVAVFVVFFCVQALFTGPTTAAVDVVASGILDAFGPLFLGAMFLAVAYCLFLLVGPWGDIKLGGPETEPSYTYPTYFSLVFTAGIAAGVVFWGPAEALFHYDTPPSYFDAPARSDAAVGGALAYSLFHWGLSAWSAYAVVGVPIAYFVFRHGAPLRVSTILAPFLGVDGLDSRWSRFVDTLAVFATVGGVATSVALIAQQFLAGVAFQWGVTAGSLGPLLFVGGVTLLFVLSAVTGVHRGMRRIAALTVVLFALFGVVLVAVGPRSYVAARGTSAAGSYIVHFVPMSLFVGGDWVADWTVWNWSWWFSWAPFAGLFVAALSRGRRVRTVVFTTVVATGLATMVWFLLLGGTSLFVQQTGQADVLGAVTDGGSEAVAGFALLSALPLGQLLTFLFLALIVAFLTTSADTSTLVVSILATERGRAPSTGSIVFWGAFQGSVAVAVLLVGGAETLQALAVLTGGPFAVLSLVAMGGLTLTWYREERGHTSLVGRVRARLPAIATHPGFEPPEEDQ